MAVERMSTPHSWRVPRLIWFAALLMVVAALLARQLTPTHMVADDKPPMALETLVPKQFGEWVLDPGAASMVVDPTVQQTLDSLYTQTLNRTYVSKSGERVMLSIAYGRNQNTESTAAHRPEFCYTAQGWVVTRLGVTDVQLDRHRTSAVRLDSRASTYRQPISYWVTLDESASVPGWHRKLHQLKYGLQGLIVDGMLVRVSNLRSAEDPRGLEVDFALQDRFLRDLEQAVPQSARARFFGS
ncbi:MAG: EpsI family protein [Aquabacterium sp.]|uniref:exosortase-associated protein EpsI, B-type n=1 Tax=Aquabacterium sp. TaxID=1872578 RepID=UPI001214EB2C|nr:exosortase-associated protein EpsI, B-type [Aquabacterium sp.]TAK97867.1 MAG: EpsI family protein [Aquabacterium sp.]